MASFTNKIDNFFQIYLYFPVLLLSVFSQKNNRVTDKNQLPYPSFFNCLYKIVCYIFLFIVFYDMLLVYLTFLSVTKCSAVSSTPFKVTPHFFVYFFIIKKKLHFWDVIQSKNDLFCLLWKKNLSHFRPDGQIWIKW